MTPEQVAVRREAARLRVTLDLPTEEIAARLGIKVTYAYKILKGLHRKKRTRVAVHFWWSEREYHLLRQLYPSASKAAIGRALPGRTWGTIERKASELGLRRHPNMRIQLRHDTHPIVDRLRTARIGQKVTTAALGRKTGMNRQSFTHWELGLMQPSLKQLDKWAAALGFTLTLGGHAQVSMRAPPSNGFSLFDGQEKTATAALQRRNPGGSLSVPV